MPPNTEAVSAASSDTPKLTRSALATRGSVATSQIPDRPRPDAFTTRAASGSSTITPRQVSV
ncbi:hypothetical protein CHKEEEPN_3233 [Methylorubrum podarium]|nr:hypothetical protein CHKEEEPN_3233 [Methylorubrum podarium]